MPTHPEVGRFDEDPRVHIDKLSGRYQYEDDESGQEFEWSDAAKAWIPIVSDRLGIGQSGCADSLPRWTRTNGRSSRRRTLSLELTRA